MTDNDRIRRDLGFDLIKAARDSGVQQKSAPAPQPAKTQEPEKVVTILDND